MAHSINQILCWLVVNQHQQELKSLNDKWVLVNLAVHGGSLRVRYMPRSVPVTDDIHSSRLSSI
eukprot:scaffold244364_cov38-Prasinocladus_malaysianus.AAC.1